jgi:outer membrane protein assembly factor BamB
MKKILPVLFVALSACSSLPDWTGAGDDKAPLPGERISVIDSGTNLQPDEKLASDTIPGNDAKISLENPILLDVGEAAPKNFVIANPPVIADEKIFVIDGLGSVNAFKTDGTKIWGYASDPDQELPGGGLAYANGVIYATRGNGEVIAISSESGTEIWKKNLGAHIRKNPAVGENKIFVATSDNQLFALNLVDGATVWRHSGSSESTINYGSPAPAVKDGTVVIAYASGEIFALNAERGSELWAENISTGTERRKTASTFVDVSATPLLVDGISYIGSQNGSVVAYNTGTGYRVWEQKIGSVEDLSLIHI